MVDFPQFCKRETTFVNSYLLSCTPHPFWKGVYSKRKEFAPNKIYFKRKNFLKIFPFRVGVNSFLFESRPLFSREQKNQNYFDMSVSLESVSLSLQIFWKNGDQTLRLQNFFMLNSAEHEIFSANKYKNGNTSWLFHDNNSWYFHIH